MIADWIVVGVVVVTVLVVIVLGDVRDRRRPDPPIPPRVLDRYDRDGRRIDL